MKLLKVAPVALLLAACADQEQNFAEQPADKIFKEANDLLEKKSYKNAAKVFAEVEKNHPYSDFAVRAQLLSAYAFYLDNSYEEATEAFGVFIQLHPSHKDVAYAYYMRGMCAYEQIPIVQRDQGSAEEAMKFFNELTSRFPDSKYAKDAQSKIILLKDHLAGKEMDIGRYYMSTYSYVAAINRFKNIIDQYSQTNHVGEALYRLVEAYIALGIKDQAQVYAAILGKNYKNSRWYEKAYALINNK
ncbi:MAG: Outer membrane protein assembly factor BamD [Holosporales bacterium]